MHDRTVAVILAVLALSVWFAGTAAAQGCDALCGNGIAQFPEECDDGNRQSGDGCSATCILESGAGRCAGVPATPGTALDAVLVTDQLTQPTHVAAPPLEPYRLFVTEQAGYVRLVFNGALSGIPFLDIHDEVSLSQEQGLLGIAFHPNYATNGRFFVSYTGLATGVSPACDNRVGGPVVLAEYHVSANLSIADESSKRVLLTIPHPFTNHNGGMITFGPDGFLYMGVGDGGGGGDPCEAAQNDADPLGKILRIDVDNPPANPLTAVWAKGVRNPWRFAFDPANGNFYLGDVGQGLYEEIDFVPAPVTAGRNYGWDVFEGRHCFEPMTGCSLPGATVPVLEYCHFQNDPACDVHSRGCSVTGGLVYRGCAMPDLRGRYFYSDFCTAFVRSFQGVSGGNAQNLVNHTADLLPAVISSVTSFGEDARGELYIADRTGKLWKLVPGT